MSFSLHGTGVTHTLYSLTGLLQYLVTHSCCPVSLFLLNKQPPSLLLGVPQHTFLVLQLFVFRRRRQGSLFSCSSCSCSSLLFHLLNALLLHLSVQVIQNHQHVCCDLVRHVFQHGCALDYIFLKLQAQATHTIFTCTCKGEVGQDHICMVYTLLPHLKFSAVSRARQLIDKMNWL